MFVLNRFYLVAALMGVTAVTGMATGFGLFYRLLYIFGIATVFGFLWNWMSVRSLHVEVERRSHRVRVGDDVEARITIRNLGSVPKPVLEVQDLTDLPGYSSGMALTLGSRSFRSWRTLTPARKRGVYTMGPVRVSNTDFLGLFQRSREFCGTDELVVYPRVYDMPGFSIPGADLTGESSSRRRSHDLSPHASSVRDYAFGDSISRVHWNSTARLGRLMSKEFDLGQSSDVWILVDLHRDVQAGELEESTDEYGVSIAASLARKYLASDMPVGLVSYGDQRYYLPAETGAGQMDRVMEFLARSKAEGRVALEDALPLEEALWGYHSTLVVITPSHRPAWVVGLRELARRRVRVVAVLLDGITFGGVFPTLGVAPALQEAGIPTYAVRSGESIPIAMSRPYLAADAERARREVA